ncbi:MAG: tryptophan-rich sensory protein [Nevskia sp.]
MSGARRSPWQPVAVAGGIAIAVSTAGALLTDLSPWYYALRRPSWQPPDWLFGPVWTTIFILSTLAAVLAWRGSANASDRRRVVWLFGINILLNLLWSALFFQLRRPDLAFAEVLFLWLSIVLLIAGLWPLSPFAGLLLLPYLFWVTFAATLTFAVCRLNAPFV